MDTDLDTTTKTSIALGGALALGLVGYAVYRAGKKEREPYFGALSEAEVWRTEEYPGHLFGKGQGHGGFNALRVNAVTNESWFERALHQFLTSKSAHPVPLEYADVDPHAFFMPAHPNVMFRAVESKSRNTKDFVAIYCEQLDGPASAKQRAYVWRHAFVVNVPHEGVEVRLAAPPKHPAAPVRRQWTATGWKRRGGGALNALTPVYSHDFDEMLEGYLEAALWESGIKNHRLSDE